MNGRGGVVTFFIFLLLSIIILLQILSMVQSDRFYEGLNRLDEIFESFGSMRRFSRASGTPSTLDKKYTGNEGDWLIWGFGVEPKTLNQFSAENDIYSRWITVPYIFEPLLVYDFDDLTMKPWLAEGCEISDDGLEYTFHLRNDVYFSDGVPVTADDVIFTYETAVNPEVDAANIANLFIDVEKAVKVNKGVVKFFMKRRYFKALENLCFWDFGILPKHIYEFSEAEEFNKRVSDPVGSGPFVFEKWETGREVVLRRNENYWGVKPKLKKIIYKFIPNSIGRVQALRSHEVDIAIPEPEQFADLINDDEFNKEFRCLSYWNPGVPFFYIGWNQDTAFFSDRRVRLAMTHIINREQIVSKLLKGLGRTITGPFFINGPQNDPNIEPWPYDLNRARELLDETGWIDSDEDGLRDKKGVPFRFKFMYSSDNALYRRLATLLKDEAAKVGIEVIPEPYEWSVVINRITDREFESMVMGWGGDVLEDFYQIFHSSQIGSGGSNYVGFRNKQADDIMEEVRQTLDEGKRNELCHKLHRIFYEEQPYTFLFTRPTFRLVDKRFKNVNIYKLGPKYWEWYVPKEQQRYK
ncbi:MAG: peptide-binding protein [Planctomycetota bacterium]|nr:MAG: peptide-binding protein [Planctomycetota bacterium]